MADKKQRLVYSILEFLQASMDDGTIRGDDKEGIEVAIQCIAEAFSVDTNDEGQKSQLSIKPANLQQIFDVYLKTSAAKKGSDSSSNGKSAATSTSTSTPSASASASTSTSQPTPSAADTARAEKLKGEGNTLMSSRNYPAAIAKYTEAISINPSNPVYYSNRAAAHSQAGDHDKAIDDANEAKSIDGGFAKAYSRLGHAYFSLGKYAEAVEAYEKGVELDPTNASMKSSLATARSRRSETESVDLSDTPSGSQVSSPAPNNSSSRSSTPSGGDASSNPLAGLAGLMGGMGGGAGGMPDISALLNNPQLMSMAQSMMGNGGLERMMQNPTMQRMAERYQSGQGMPSMQEMMSDPSIRDLAGQFGGMGGAGAGQGNNSNNRGGNDDMYS